MKMSLKEWHQTTLGSVSVDLDGIQTGPFGSELHASDYVSNGVPVVMPKDLISGRIDTRSVARIPETLAAILEKYQVKSGDILFGRRGDVGRCGLVRSEEDGWVCGTGCIRTRVDRTRAEPSYMVQLLSSPTIVQWLTDNAVGQTMLNLNMSILSRLPLILPPLYEQRKIATILSSVDDTIEKIRAIIDQLQIVKKAIMQELLTRGIPGRHTRFTNTDIGEVPEEWEVAPLSALLDGIDAGWSPQCESRPAGPGEWGVLKVSAVSWGEFRPDENKKLPDHLSPRHEIEVRAGDVLLSRANTPDLVGRAVAVRETPNRLLLSDKLLRLRPRVDRIDPGFLNLALNAPTARIQIREGATGSSKTMKNISQEKLRAVLLPVPPVDEQRCIVQAVSSIVVKEGCEQEYIECLRSLKSSLMSVLLTGNVRVKLDDSATLSVPLSV